MPDKYALQIFWNEDEEGFTICQEFLGLSAFGEIREEALCEVQIALDLIIETYQEKGISLSKPQSVLLTA